MNKFSPQIGKDFEYCVETLPKVSRTFALVISILKGEIHQAILLAYLLCRIADTIEDNSFLSADQKSELLNEFLKALKNQENWQESIKKVQLSFVERRHENEDYNLTFNSDRVFRVFDTVDQETKICIVPWIEEMVVGMQKYQAFSTPSSTITAIKDIDELKNYCYYVAGTVGIMLTHLFIRFSRPISPENQKKMHELSVSFGIGLQMTNILKDFNEDLERGWCYLPESILKKHGFTPETFSQNLETHEAKAVISELRGIARQHLKDALHYTFAIPKLERSIRLFCLWPLHMANQTLAALHEKSDLFKGKTVKITRSQVRHTILRTSFDWFSNKRQLKYFEKTGF